jgi:hypothetical protein
MTPNRIFAYWVQCRSQRPLSMKHPEFVAVVDTRSLAGAGNHCEESVTYGELKRAYYSKWNYTQHISRCSEVPKTDQRTPSKRLSRIEFLWWSWCAEVDHAGKVAVKRVKPNLAKTMFWTQVVTERVPYFCWGANNTNIETHGNQILERIDHVLKYPASIPSCLANPGILVVVMATDDSVLTW